MSTNQETIQNIVSNLAAAPVAGIMDNALCLKLTLRKPGKTKKVSTQVKVAIEQPAQPALEGVAADRPTETVALINQRVNVDVTRLRVSKQIINAPEFTAVDQFDRGVKKYLLSKALPAIFQAGAYLIPLGLVNEVYIVMGNMQRSRQALVDAVIEALPRIKAESEAALGDLSALKDFPSAEILAKSFAMTFDFISYGVSERLQQISQDIYDQEVTKRAETFAEARTEIREALRQSMAELVEHACERLSQKSNGKVRKIEERRIGQLKEFLATFDDRNIVGDDELAAQVARAKQLLEGVDQADLVKNQDMRERMRAGFDTVREALDGMIVTTGRRFRLDDDDEENEDGEPEVSIELPDGSQQELSVV